MPPWPAQASGECILCTFKHVFTRPSTAHPAARHSLKPNSKRTLSVRKLLASSPNNGRSGNAETVRNLKEPALRGKPRDNQTRFSGARKVDFKADPTEPDHSAVRAAILQQLQSLKHRIVTKRTTEEDAHYSVAALDPENKHWESFEAEVRTTIEDVEKHGRGVLKSERYELYRRLYYAQTDRKKGSTIPTAEVTRHLEFAYFDHILKSKQPRTSESLTFNSLDDYTDLRYPTEWYASARTTQRQIHLHVGPTNSGKTYNAIKRLEEAGNGYYCGPLRLLAHEVYARFQAKGIPCHLITGDDVRVDGSDDTKLRSSTVEMVDTNSRVDVAVIDEVQMMADENRGWAWTRAFLGSNAKEVHLCGETRVIPLVRELSASMGDTLIVHNYERLSPLKVMSRSLKGNLRLLRKGDCVVSFSVVGLHALKKEIERRTGRRVAIVYGSLPPETRAAQAELFNNPDNDYDFLVASDAIGMGLNLAIKRIVFESVYKHNGRMRQVLSVPQIKQIAGRAGRYRTARQGVDTDTSKDEKATPAPQAIGLVTCMEEADLPIIQKALETEPEPIKAAGLLPPSEFVEEFAARLPEGLPFEYIYQRVCDVAKMHPRFKLCEVTSQTGIARILDSVKDLTTRDRLCFSSAPAGTRKELDVKLLIALGKCVANGKPVACIDIPEIPLEILDAPMAGTREYLAELESLHHSLILYLWLSYRFVAIFKEREQATHAKSLTELRISETLTKFSHTSELKDRLKRLKLRQIKTSDTLDELHPDAGYKMHPVLSHDEPNAEEITIESPSLPEEALDAPNLSAEDFVEESITPENETEEAEILKQWAQPNTVYKDAYVLERSREVKGSALSSHLASKNQTAALSPAGDDGGLVHRPVEAAAGS